MNNVLLIMVGLIAILSIILAVAGGKKHKIGLMGLSIFLMACIACLLLVLQLGPTVTHEYRVAYVKNTDIVVIDDENGNTKRYSLKEIAHENVVFGVGDYVVVVTTGGGKAVYIAPTEQIMPANSANSSTGE